MGNSVKVQFSLYSIPHDHPAKLIQTTTCQVDPLRSGLLVRGVPLFAIRAYRFTSPSKTFYFGLLDKGLSIQVNVDRSPNLLRDRGADPALDLLKRGQLPRFE
jgi:hypothetical protein